MKASILCGVFLIALWIVYDAVSRTGKFFNYPYEAQVLAAYFLGGLVILLASVYRSGVSIIDVLVLYFLVISIGFSGLYQVATDFFPWDVVHDRNAIVGSVITYTVFAAAYLIGGRFAQTRPAAVGMPVGYTPSFRLVISMTLAVAVVCLAQGGSALISPREGSEVVGAEGIGGQLLQVGKSCSLAAFLFLLCNWQNTRRYPLLTLFAAALVVLSYNPITAPRFQFVAALIATLSTLAMFIKLSSTMKAALYLLLFVANYLLFGPTKTLSSGISNFDFMALQNAYSSIGDYAYRVDFDSLQISANVVTYTAQEGFNYGYQLLGAAFFFVPRMLWESKPYPTSIFIHDELGYQYVNLSLPLPMEFYAAGGWLIVAGLGYLLGYFVKRISMRSAVTFLNGGLRTEYTVLVALIAGYTPIIMRGAINGTAPFFGFSFLAYFAIAWLSRRSQWPALSQASGNHHQTSMGDGFRK